MTKTFHLLKDSDWSLFLDWFLPLRGKGKLTIKAETYRKKRTSEANRYYFGVCVQVMAKELGYRVDEMHDVLLMGYFGTEEREFRGKKYLFPKRRTTSPDIISSFEFQGLVQYAQQIAAELNISLPDQEKGNDT